MRWLFLLMFLGSGCIARPTRENKCLKWEYSNCLDNNLSTIEYCVDTTEIRVPIFKYPIPRKVVDSLCYKFLNDYNDTLLVSNSVVQVDFGEYYYTDSLLTITITDANRDNNKELSFKFYVSEKKYSLSENNSCQIIYVPTVGAIYALIEGYDSPKVAKLIQNCLDTKSVWKTKYNAYISSYFTVDCGNKK